MKSPTYGDVTISNIVDIIKKYTETNPDYADYNVVIGTDSQNFTTTKIVVVVAVYSTGHGGMFFYDILNIKRINNIRQKLFFETNKSLEYAQKIMDEFDRLQIETGFDYANKLNFGIHVDAGTNGPTNQLIPELVSWVKNCGFDVKVKPDSFVASSIADKYSK